MKTLFLISMVVLVGWLGSGCVSKDPETFSQQVKKWAPLGTPAAKAQKKMESEGFQCSLIKTDNIFNTNGMDYLDCERIQVWFHDWNARILLSDDKVSGYGPISVK